MGLVAAKGRIILSRLGMPALLGVLILLNCFAVWNFILFSKDLVYGDKSADELLIRPIYHPFRVPTREITKARDAVGRVGSDFAQVYFPAQDAQHLQDAFDTSRTLDPWKRPSRYAPFVILVCAATICQFDFGIACLLHMLLQLLLLYAVVYWMFRTLGLQRYWMAALLFANACLFLTPVGLSWLERGQFSLYLAGSYALLVLGLLRRQPWLVAAAALLAFIKWTSFPAIFVILAVYLLSSKNLLDLKSKALLVALFAGVTIGLLVLPALFTRGADTFVRGLLTQELEDLPRGASLLRYVPRLVVKLLPLAAIALGYISARSSKDASDWLVPYAAGAVIIMLVYPTRAYEYGLPSLLGFIPLLLSWGGQAEETASWPRRALLGLVLLFYGLASFSTRLLPSLLSVVELHVGVALLLMLSPALLRLIPGRLPGTALDPKSAGTG